MSRTTLDTAALAHDLRLAVGRRRDIHPLMWVIAVLFVIYFALEPLQQLL